ncbi:MAG: hypothetical protein AAF651_11455 [Cyanobacteria bacterium P01_C01_bin.73]
MSYCENKYRQTAQSDWLPNLDLQRLAIASTQEFRADAIEAFGA